MDRVDGLVQMARRELSGGQARSSSADRYTVFVNLDADVLHGGVGECHIDGGSALTPETLRRLTCDASLVTLIRTGKGEVLSVGRKTRVIPAALRRALRARDGGCRFPGCTHAAFVDGHHIEHWSAGGDTSLSNLVLLCPFHHRLVHEGKIRIEVVDDGRFTFFTRWGGPIETAVLSVRPGEMEESNAELHLRIDPLTLVPNWDGGRWDCGVAVEGLLRRDASDRTADGSGEPLEGGSIG